MKINRELHEKHVEGGKRSIYMGTVSVRVYNEIVRRYLAAGWSKVVRSVSHSDYLHFEP